MPKKKTGPFRRAVWLASNRGNPAKLETPAAGRARKEMVQKLRENADFFTEQ